MDWANIHLTEPDAHILQNCQPRPTLHPDDDDFFGKERDDSEESEDLPASEEPSCSFGLNPADANPKEKSWKKRLSDDNLKKLRLLELEKQLRPLYSKVVKFN